MKSISDAAKRVADIRVNQTKITFNVRTTRALGLQEGDVIDIVMDMRGEYYIICHLKADEVIGKYDGRLARINPKDKDTYRIYSSRLANALRQRLGTEQKAFSLYCGETTEIDGQKALPLILRIQK